MSELVSGCAVRRAWLSSSIGGWAGVLVCFCRVYWLVRGDMLVRELPHREGRWR